MTLTSSPMPRTSTQHPRPAKFVIRAALQNQNDVPGRTGTGIPAGSDRMKWVGELRKSELTRDNLLNV